MYRITPTERFFKDLEYYTKKKRFINIHKDIKKITDEIEKGNLLGERIPNLKITNEGRTYKVRVVNTDTKAGKSNGYRLIYYAIRDDLEVFLVTIYYKKENNRIPSNEEITQLVMDYCKVPGDSIDPDEVANVQNQNN